MEKVKRQLYIDGLRLRESSDGKPSRIVEGTAIVFNSKSNLIFIDDWTVDEREVILPEAVTKEFLDTQDFVLTLYHNPEIVLGRSNHGQGTIKYEVRDDGVHFSCEMPNTQHGDEALELVRSGILTGCSFIFTTDYFNGKNVECRIEDGAKVYYVNTIEGIYDFTLTYRPAYSATDCEARDLIKRLRETDANSIKDTDEMTDEQLNTLAEKVADLVEERMKARVDETETPKDDTADAPAETPKEEPVDTPKEEPVDTPAETPKDEPADTPKDDNAEDENERSMKESLDLIKRALDIA